MKVWFEGKEFTKDWTSNKLDLWLPILAPRREQPCSILEVGSYEGRSAVAFLEALPLSSITCIDIFKESEIEARFDRNLASYGSRVTKHKASAVPMMERLLKKGRSYDLIYLDAAKDRAGAFVVSALGWALLKVGGILIWDDLAWRPRRDQAKRPEMGSRLFMSIFAGCMELLHDDPAHRTRWPGQCVARKIGEWPSV